jgi:hypothetical protein
MTTKLETAEAVVSTLYGRAADMARELDRSRTAIWKYVQRGQFAGDLYGPIQSKARLAGFVVSDELFTPVSVHPSLIARIMT